MQLKQQALLQSEVPNSGVVPWKPEMPGVCSSGSCECPPAPAPAPPSPPGPFSAQRLKVVNGCSSQPLWIAHIAAGAVGPDPQDIRIDSGKSKRFQTAVDGKGLISTRFWPKMGCACPDTGSNCTIGASGGPGEACVVHAPWGDDYSHCSPPVDSKFEATFAPADNPLIDTVDMSLVDGYSVPFKLEISGGTCTRLGAPFQKMDCSGLSLNQCPTAEILNGKSVNLRAIHPTTGKIAGCFSPCLRLVDDKWHADPSKPDSPAAGPYCCAGDDGTPEVCNAGPILQTKYVKLLHESCPAAYSYAYDDKRATIVCTTSTEYTVTFYCPSDSADDVQMVV